MPPQKSWIAELLRKQTKVKETECETFASPYAQESSYYNLDIQDDDDAQLSQSMDTTFASSTDQFPTSLENTQK
uniref:Ovule protein n=1 Tax=Elaeophora elaphi TaxID=1147741 RepID=A0A0R3RSA2_9BILA